MNSKILIVVAALTMTASVGTSFGQNGIEPGQLASGTQAMLRPVAFPSFSSSAARPSMVLQAEERRDRKINRIWVASMFAVAAATSMDAASSWGKREANPLLASSDGTFGTKGLSIKAGFAAGTLIPQVLMRRHKDWKTKLAIGNFVEASLFGGIAARNMGISK